MASKPREEKEEEEMSGDYNKLGPIPLSHFGNERKFNPNVDLSKDKATLERIDKVMEETRNKHEKKD